MKKFISYLFVTVFVCISLILPANAESTVIVDIKNLQVDYEAVFGFEPESEEEERILKEQYAEHLRLRPLKADLSDEQKDLLRAFGLSEKRINNITNGEYADLLAEGQIQDYTFLEKYINKEEIKASTRYHLQTIRTELINKGLTEKESIEFLSKNFDYDFYRDKSAIEIRRDLSTPILRGTAYCGTCHIFSSSNALSYIPSAAHFHRDSGTQTISDLSYAVGGAARAARYLYGSLSNTSYNYHLYGQEYPMYSSKYHEGIDMYKWSGASLYSICPASIIRLRAGSVSSSTNFSALTVYSATYNVTIHYLHLNYNSSFKVNDVLMKGDHIGYESQYGASSAHTHLEFYADRQSQTNEGTSAQDANLVSKSPYSYIWGM